MAEVGVIQPGVVAAARQQLVMRPLLHDAPVIQHKDAIRAFHRGEAMGDHDGGTACQRLIKSLLNLRLGQRINAGGRLIENQDGRVLQE